MSYSLIEEIDEVYKPSNKQSTDAFKMSMQGRRPDIPNVPSSGFGGPSYGSYVEEPRQSLRSNVYSLIQDRPKEVRNTGYKNTMSNNMMMYGDPTQQDPTPPAPAPTPAPPSKPTQNVVTNEVIYDGIKKMAIYMNNVASYFADREKRLFTKIQLMEQLLKGLGIIIIVLIVFMMVRKN